MKQRQAIRKSARLKGIDRFQMQAVSKDKITQQQPFLSPTISNTPSKEASWLFGRTLLELI